MHGTIFLALALILDFEPCDGAISLSRVDLQLQARLVEQLGMDRSPAQTGGWPIYRLVIEPDYLSGETGGTESTIAIYLPESGDAIVEVARAERSIRDANSWQRAVAGKAGTFVYDVRAKPVRVPVTFARGYLDRDLALAIQKRTFETIKRANLPDSASTTIRLHPTTYTITSWQSGYGTKCAKATLHAPEFDQAAEGRLASSLVTLTQNPAARPETEKLIREALLGDGAPK